MFDSEKSKQQAKIILQQLQKHTNILPSNILPNNTPSTLHCNNIDISSYCNNKRSYTQPPSRICKPTSTITRCMKPTPIFTTYVKQT